MFFSHNECNSKHDYLPELVAKLPPFSGNVAKQQRLQMKYLQIFEV